jgi:acetyl esterase/lipase
MINKELRLRGIIIKTFLPFFKEKTFKLCNKALDIFMKGKCNSKIAYEQKWITRFDGTKLRICVYSPENPKENVPGLLWIHGGGYAIGVPEQDEGFIKRFINASNCVVVAPDYRRSVECPYPAALDDCYSSLLWLRDHADDYKIRNDQLMIGGNSAGGGLTAALSLYARDKNEVAIAFQMPLYPMLDDRMKTESAKDNDAPIWNSKSNYLGWRLYLGDLFGTDNVPFYASPARAASFKNLPPTFSFVGSIEPFRDETINYINKLRENNIPVYFEVYEGCFHAFDLVGANTAIGKKAAAFLMETFNYAVSHYFAEQFVAER